MSRGVAVARRLYLDDIRAQVAQHHATERSCHDLGQIHHTYARERQFGRLGRLTHVPISYTIFWPAERLHLRIPKLQHRALPDLRRRRTRGASRSERQSTE